MSVPHHIKRVEEALTHRSTLHDLGITPRALVDAVSVGELVRVARGWFVSGATWRDWFPESRHLAAVIAAHNNAGSPPLFSHSSAAVLLGLPLWGFKPGRVHTINSANNKSSGSVLRHELEVPEYCTGTVAGYRCTSPARTVLDIGRTATTETALGCADKAVARVASQGRVLKREAWQHWVADLTKMLDDLPARSRGVERARRIIALADPRAESVLESVSRLQLLRLGFEVNLQVPVESPSGGLLRMDFELLGLRIFGECDGDFKYTDPALLDGRGPADVVVNEKKRDNWVAGRTNYRMVHWGARNVGTAEQLARLLRSYHVPIPRLR